MSALLFIISAVFARHDEQIGSVPTIWHLYGIFIKALDWLFAFSIVIAIIILISVGVQLSASGANPESHKNALNRLYFTLAGVAIMFLAWIIVTRIIPNFLGVGAVNLEGGNGGGFNFNPFTWF